MTTDLIVAGILLLILGIAIVYIVREKKHGVKCIGCPAAGTCACRNNGSCQSDTREKSKSL